MELFMLCFALFIFFFGSVVAMKIIEFGLAVGDKTAQKIGKVLLWPFAIIYKLVSVRTEEYRVRIVDDQPTDSVNNERLENQRRPVVIEHQRTLNLLETLRAKALPRKK